MKRILSLALALLLLFAFSGCTKETDALIGTWEGELDDAAYLNQLIRTSYGEAMAQYWTIDSFPLPIVMTFREDGTYTQTVDQNKFAQSIELLRQTLRKGLVEFIQDLIDASGEETTVDAVLESQGITVDSFLDEALSEEVINTIIADYTFEGKFDAKEGKLFTSAGPEFNIDESIYETYEVTEDTLTLQSIVSGEDDARLDEEHYPIVLKRAP